MLFTAEHEALRRSVTQFVAKEINPYVDEWENHPPFPAHTLFKKCAEIGLLGVTKPQAYGGMELDYSYGLVVAEALGSAHCGGVPLAIGVQTDMATPALARFGSDELKQEFLTPVIAGEYVASIAVSETTAGSDVAQIKTHAHKKNGDYIINGSKMWITNATQADFFCVLAITSDEANFHSNKSLIIVPRKCSGVSIGKPLHKLGMLSSDTAPIYFEDVKVPQRYVIGSEGQGFMLQMMQFQEERLWGAANTLLGMENCIQATIDYCRERHTFGQPLINNQLIHFKMAELQTEIESLRALTYTACEQYINGSDVLRLASMAKLKAGRLLRQVADQCLQFWGGNGFMWDNIASRLYRDGRLASIGGGADEIMLGIICKTMGILPGKKK